MGSIEAGLLERSAEVERLEDLLESAADGVGRLALIEGPAGIGKTRLLRHACESAGQRGIEVLRARGGELERDFPYGIVRQLFEVRLRRADPPARQSLLEGAAAHAEAVLVPGGAGEPEPEVAEGAAVLHGLYWLTSNLAERSPLLLAIDDAHWADGASLGFVSYIARRIEDLPVLLLLTLRHPEHALARGALARIRADPEGSVLRPRPLSQSATADVVRAALGPEAVDEFSAACHVATGGNPFLLGEVVAALAADGVSPTAAAAEDVSRLVPESVRRHAFARLVRLPEAAGALARSVAVLGSDVEFREAAALAGLDEEDAALAADALVAADLLRPAATLQFVHPLIAEAIHGDMPRGERARAHARAAALLHGAGATRDRVAAQLVACDPAGAAWAVDVLRAAAQEALARGAPDAAIALLHRALHEPPPSEQRLEVVDELGSAEVLAGDPAGAEHLGTALDLAGPGRARALIARRLAQALAVQASPDEAVSVLDAAIAELDEDERELGLSLEADAATAGRMGRSTYPATVRRLARFGDDMAGDTPAERLLLANLAFEQVLQGGSAGRAAMLAGRAIEGGLLSDHRPSPPAVYDAVYALVVADELVAAENACETASANAHAQGSLLGVAASSAIRSHLWLRRGAVAQAESEARTAHEAAETGQFALVPMTAAYLANALIERGELDEAARTIEDHAGGDISDAFFPNFLLDTRGRLRIAAGDVERGLADLRELAAREEAWRGGGNPGVTPYRSNTALAFAQLGEIDLADGLVEQELRLAEKWGTPRVIGIALRASGVVKGEHGIEDLRRAVAMLAGSGSELEHARALTDLGAAVRRAGRPSNSRRPLRNGLDLARRCGAVLLQDRAHQELLASGARPRRFALTGIESLTPRELRIAAMAADGRTNREIAQTLFLSLRTVEMHLSGSYRKLGIKSRSELPASLVGVTGQDLRGTAEKPVVGAP